jgi:hypothetical protein
MLDVKQAEQSRLDAKNQSGQVGAKNPNRAEHQSWRSNLGSANNKAGGANQARRKRGGARLNAENKSGRSNSGSTHNSGSMRKLSMRN